MEDEGHDCVGEAGGLEFLSNDVGFEVGCFDLWVGVFSSVQPVAEEFEGDPETVDILASTCSNEPFEFKDLFLSSFQPI